jgi:hypothetical protein
MMEMDTVSEMTDSNPILTQLIAVEYLIASQKYCDRMSKIQKLQNGEIAEILQRPISLGNITTNMYLHEEVQSIGKHARASKALMMEC